MNRAPSVGYEVATDLVELRDEAGHRYFLGSGAEIPDWVDQALIDQLVATGEIQRFGVI